MAEQSPSSAPSDGSSGSESFDNLVIQTPQLTREDYIQNAVNFLSHPKVKGSPVFQRRSFLEKKGLTSEEIDEAFRRVPDPNPNGTDAAAAGSQQANNHNKSVELQPYAEVQPQAATGAVTAGPIAPHAKAQFSWVNTVLGAGLFLGLGASAAITLKKWFIPSLQSWTRRGVTEEDEKVKDELTCKLYEEIREAIKVSASAFSDIARTNQEVLASKDEDREVLMKLREAFESQANAFKSLNETILNHIRGNQFSQYLLEEHFQPVPWNGRHSFMPLPAEPTYGYGSYSGSYTEQRLQRPGYGFQPQMSNDRQNVSLRGNYQGDEGSHDEVVAGISNMEKDGKGKDALEKKQTNDNTSQLKKHKKAKKAGSVGLASLDTIHEKEMHAYRENAVRLDTVSTEREIIDDPLMQQSNNVHQGELNVTENPNSDGKKKKRRRRRSESSKGVDPSQDLTKSSEFVTNENSMHFADVAPLDAKQTTPGGIEGAAVIDHKELGENLSAKNVIDEVLADLRSKDSSSKDLDEGILTGQTHLCSNKSELELPESTADKVGVSALLPPKYPADAPASSPRLRKSKGEKLEVLSTMIDSSHHSRSVPKEDANGELNESDSLRFSDKASYPKDILNGDAVAQADGKPKATKRRRKKVSLKQVPADNVKTLDEQVSQVDTLDLKGVNATQANDVVAIESASPNAQKAKKKPSNSELQSWDPALDNDSSADLANLRPENSLIRPKNSADAAEQNYDSAVHPASGAINFLDHFSSSKMKDLSVSAEHKQGNEDETLRDVKNKKKSKRKQGTVSIEPNDVLESLLPTDKTSLTCNLGTSRAIVPFVAAENMNNEDENVKNGKEKKRQRKANKEMPVAEKENPNSDNQGIDIGTQETLSVIQKGSMGRDIGKDRGSKVTQNNSIVQHKPEDATLEKKLHQNSVDDQDMLLADKDHVHISKDVRKSTSKLKPHAKSKHDDSIKGRMAPNPNPARNLVKDFSTSPLVSSDSTEGTPQNVNRYRVAVRKVSSKRYEQASEKSKKENRKVGAGAIFNDANSEGSDDELDTKNDKAFMEASANNLSTSGDSGISSAAYDESDVPDDDGTVSLSQKSLRDGLHIGSILRGSSSYKKARKKQSELLDDDTIVPDSQPADGLWD